ncbi:MAG: hypothetical protein M3R00_02920, partial [Pseudomonadota bacterium]|nr:hypothetical protein [Pseudomonadota bacterium]
RLMQFHKDHPEDLMACLALAIVFNDDELLRAQYQETAYAINSDEYNGCIKIMEMIASYMGNIATFDTSHLKKASRCTIM